MLQTVHIAVFASGRGSNFRAVHQALQRAEDIPARIELCVSNNPEPGAFSYAREQGITTIRLSPKMFPDDPETYEGQLLQLLEEHHIDLILLTGYMRKLPPGVVRKYRGRILNIHPALLPEFGGPGMYGMYVHQAVLDRGKTESGATIHLVDEEYDTGPIIARKRVPVLVDDTPESLAERVLGAEHQLLSRVAIEAVDLLLKGESIEGINIDEGIEEGE